MDSGYGRMLGAPPLTHFFGSQYFLSSYSVSLTVLDFRKSKNKNTCSGKAYILHSSGGDQQFTDLKKKKKTI